MEPPDIEAFTEGLVATLTADGRVLGLVALGSMAATDRSPDVWSDHDFWVVVVPGTGRFRGSPDAAAASFSAPVWLRLPC